MIILFSPEDYCHAKIWGRQGWQQTNSNQRVRDLKKESIF